ncbi:amidohydrolase family protein [Tateyamaria sp.]|uniref:amidohydrolase family protein n=1 Tax=Tateyamaria sp. TaxID=1929288 RepID=UPI00329A86CC
MIDSHVHFWQLALGDYKWITQARPKLKRDFLPQDFRDGMTGTSVVGCIAVQAAPTIAETEFLLDLAKNNDCILGVTGWVDLTSQDVTKDIERLSQHAALKAIRPMIDLKPSTWLSAAEFGSGLAALSASRLHLEALASPHHVKAIAQVAKEHPGLKIVVNHAAKPTPEDLTRWQGDISELAACDNVFCKVSGFTQQSPDHNHYLRVFETLLDVFGPHRLMWGSDYPVLLETSGYMDWLGQTDRLLDALTADERLQITRLTATNFYDLSHLQKPIPFEGINV